MPSRSASACLSVENDGDQALVRIPADQFGAAGAEPADEQLLTFIAGLQQSQLSLDFSNVTFLTSLGLAMLVTLNKRLAEDGKRLALVNVQPHIYEIFDVTRLNTLLEVRQLA